jgi:hypothetical protein
MHKNRHWSADTLLAELAEREKRDLAAQGVTVTLGEGDTAWNPASTSSLILGPCRVTYVQHADGGVTATEQETPARGGRRG